MHWYLKVLYKCPGLLYFYFTLLVSGHKISFLSITYHKNPSWLVSKCFSAASVYYKLFAVQVQHKFDIHGR